MPKQKPVAPTPRAIPALGSRGPPPNLEKLATAKRLQQAHAQVGEIVDIMRVNVEKVLERDVKLYEAERRAYELKLAAAQFQKTAVKLKRKAWWKNYKMWIIFGFVVLAIIIVILLSQIGWQTSPCLTGEVVGVPNNGQEVARSRNGLEGGRFSDYNNGPQGIDYRMPILL